MSKKGNIRIAKTIKQNQPHRNRTFGFLVLFPILFVIGVLAGFLLKSSTYSTSKSSEKQESDLQITHSTPRIDSSRLPVLLVNPSSREIKDKFYLNSLNPFRNEIEKIIEKFSKNGSVKNTSVYFRDLTNGWWFGINENEQFSPSSLMKVPVMIAIYKLAEEGKVQLSQKLAFDKSHAYEYFQDNQTTETQLTKGEKYTIEELVRNMIMYSDNEATLLILEYLDDNHPGFLSNLQEDLGVFVPKEARYYDNFITVKQYSAFFRTLYNSTYLQPLNSGHCLELLSFSNYKFGIRAGIPLDVRIASKFGRNSVPIDPEHSMVDQLHDAGIVYLQGKPYFLCIMIKGENESVMTNLMSEISREVYHSVQNQLEQFSARAYLNDVE